MGNTHVNCYVTSFKGEHDMVWKECNRVSERKKFVLLTSVGWHCWLANSDGVEVDAGHHKNTGEVIFRGN